MHARRILGYSYVFAFYMFGQVMFADEISPARNAINQNLFENQQQQLEHMVRHPSPLLSTTLPNGRLQQDKMLYIQYSLLPIYACLTAHTQG